MKSTKDEQNQLRKVSKRKQKGNSAAWGFRLLASWPVATPVVASFLNILQPSSLHQAACGKDAHAVITRPQLTTFYWSHVNQISVLTHFAANADTTLCSCELVCQVLILCQHKGNVSYFFVSILCLSWQPPITAISTTTSTLLHRQPRQPPSSHRGNTLAHRWLSPPLWWVGRVGGGWGGCCRWHRGHRQSAYMHTQTNLQSGIKWRRGRGTCKAERGNREWTNVQMKVIGGRVSPVPLGALCAVYVRWLALI